MSRCSLDSAHWKLAAEDEGGEWCPMHEYISNNFINIRAKISCRVRREGRVLPLTRPCCSGLLSTLIYLRTSRRGQGETVGMSRTSPWVNSKTPLASIASNARTPLGHIKHHSVSKWLPLLANGHSHKDLVYHTRVSCRRGECGIHRVRGRRGHLRAYAYVWKSHILYSIEHLI